MAIQSYSQSTGSNTTISGINIDEGWPPANVNNAFRQMMADVREIQASSSIASAGTTNIGAATAEYLSVTGTTTITAFDSVNAGVYRVLVFAGALTLTHNATSLILPSAANITTAANDRCGARSLGSGNWIVEWYQRASGAALVAAGLSASTNAQAKTATDTSTYMTPASVAAVAGGPWTDIASAGTTDIGAQNVENLRVTGTTTITAFGTIDSGVTRKLRFAGAVTLTHNATSLILPTGANITTAADDIAEMTSLGSGNWICTRFQRKSGTALSGTSGTWQVRAFTASGTFTSTTSVVYKVHVIGGGGAGGSGGSPAGGGGGGGAGGQSIKYWTGDGTQITVTVGAAGSTTSFGSVCSATGGSAGAANSINAGGLGGAGGTGSSGDVNLTGSRGGTGGSSEGTGLDGSGGTGAPGFMASGAGAGGGTSAATAAAANSGAGGGGGRNAAGAAGGTGFCLVQWNS
jgi:hypothetical protein